MTSRPRFTALGVALGVGAGFLAGVLLVAILGGAKPAIKETTVTVQRTTTIETVADGMAPHPTLSEGLKEAGLVALGRPIHLPPRRKERPASVP